MRIRGYHGAGNGGPTRDDEFSTNCQRFDAMTASGSSHHHCHREPLPFFAVRAAAARSLASATATFLRTRA